MYGLPLTCWPCLRPASSFPSPHCWSFLVSRGRPLLTPLIPDPREQGNQVVPPPPPPAFLNSSASHLGSPLTQPKNVQLLTTPRSHLHHCSDDLSFLLVTGLLLSTRGIGLDQTELLPEGSSEQEARGITSTSSSHLIPTQEGSNMAEVCKKQQP